ncbi:MAG: citramalate synthase [Candidatus Sumerlaeia bacterium]
MAKHTKKDVYLFDTTLRDGEQAEGIAFTLHDKIRIAFALDEFGMDYIEGGWPGSNPKARDFFEYMKTHPLKHARLAAFGSTCRKKTHPKDDPQIKALLEAETPVVVIFGKTWDFHVTHALKTTLDENLRMIRDSVAFLKSHDREVIYDAEHFFDGYKANPDYALRALQAARDGGADVIVLCDTNGGTMPTEIPPIMDAVRAAIPGTAIGIHTHNDAGMGVANAVMAVYCGAVHVQGTTNGFGERCGNCDLVQVIPNLQIKYHKRCVEPRKLRELTSLSHFVAEMANMIPDPKKPYVGRHCFTHKGGIHVSAVLRDPSTYEHINPALVGNRRRVTVSEQSGKSNIVYKAAQEYGLDPEQIDAEAMQVLQEIKEMENEGFTFEAADGSVQVMLKKKMLQKTDFFDLQGYRVIIEKRRPNEQPVCEATVKLSIGGEPRYTVAEGDGPVNALDKALRQAIAAIYPIVRHTQLTDYRVRVIDQKRGTAARVRVIIETTDGKKEWGTIGVSENIIEASWQALVHGIEYKLLEEEEKKRKRSARSKK